MAKILLRCVFAAWLCFAVFALHVIVKLGREPFRSFAFTCLGVELDKSLEWNDHIEMICKKVAAGIGMMKRQTICSHLHLTNNTQRLNSALF